MGNKSTHCSVNILQPSSGPSKRRRIQTKATDQPTLSAMFIDSSHSTTRCEQPPRQPVDIPPTLPTVRSEEHHVSDEQSSLSSAAAGHDDALTCLDDSHSTYSSDDVGSDYECSHVSKENRDVKRVMKRERYCQTYIQISEMV